MKISPVLLRRRMVVAINKRQIPRWLQRIGPETFVFFCLFMLLSACNVPGFVSNNTQLTSAQMNVNGFGTAANHGHSLLALPNKVLLVATHFGLYRSTDDGKHWSGPDKTMGDMMTYSLVSSPLDPQRLYVLAELTYSGESGVEGLYTSTDAGASWQLAASAKAVGKMFLVVAGNRSVNEVYAYEQNLGNPVRFLVSQDGGRHFTSPGTTLPFGRIQGILPIPNEPSQLLIYSNDGGVARSTDGGVHWHVLPGFDASVFSMTTGDQKSPIYADSDAGIYVSRDEGQSFQLVYAKSSYSALTAVPGEPEMVYGKTGRMIYKSVDGGHTWNALPQIKGNLEDLALDPDNTSRLFLSLSYPMEVYELDPQNSVWISLTPKA
jgi:photosystem II stability/assembly factor-like uncharacterized protein